ncbi:MAG: Hint domain-containing protein [Acetobacteraceae bacterium]
MDDTGGAGSTLVNAGTITATGPSDFAVFFDAPGDRLVIHPGAVFNGLVVGGGTDATIELASAASAGTLSGLGTDFLYFDHVDVDAGATWTLAGTNSVGLGITFTIAAGASLDVTGTLTGGAAFVLDAAILRLANGVDGGDSFDFTDVGEVGPDTLTLDAVTGTSFDNPIFGFSYLDKIVLPGVTFVAGSTAVLDVNTLTIQLQGGGEFTFGNFLLAAGAPTSFIIGEHSVQDALCFLAGTWIATPDGERLVQHLAIGDAVRLADGGVERVLWIGTGRVLVTPGRRSAATPVVVRRGALADNVPHRDLRVTKGHSLLVDGVLIPVEFLVNHRSIMWDDRAREVAIYHVELTRHGVLLADGAPAESYRDDGNRWLFQNGNAGWVLPPQPPCAPVLTGGALVDAAWQRLLLRAGRRPGLPITQDPDLHLLADGVRVDARDRSGTVHRFRLAAPPRDLRIVSRAAIPGELGLARDSRPLGVALWRVVTAQQRVIEADDHTLADGYHAFEHGNGWRWTNGEAALPAALFAGLSGPVEVELHVGCTASYLLEGEEQQPAALRLAA